MWPLIPVRRAAVSGSASKKAAISLAILTSFFGSMDLVGVRGEDAGYVLNGAVLRHCGINAVCESLNCWNCSCQSEGFVVGVTSTAVTLYSGQLVAQSEFSVVTTLAPEFG